MHDRMGLLVQVEAFDEWKIVAGVIEDITDFETNGIVVWNRL